MHRQTPTQSPTRSRLALAALLASAALLLAGCSTTTEPLPKPVADTTPTGISTGDVQSMFSKLTPEDRIRAREDLIAAGARPGRTPTVLPAPVEPPPAPAPATDAAAPVAEAAKPHAAPLTPEEQRTKLAREFAAMVRPGGGSTSLLTAMQLAAIAGGQPADQSIRARLAEAEAALSKEDKAVLDAFKSLLTAASDPATKTDSDWARLLSESAAKINASETTLSIRKALVCRRVEAFGRYNPFDPATFVAGKSQPLIVYIEPENYGYKLSSKEAMVGPVPEDRDDTEWLVEFTQKIEVRTADGVLVGIADDSTVRDLSRNKRREFFIVQRINLAATLPAGQVTIKVKLRDHATGAVAEAIIPVTLVTDQQSLQAVAK